MGRRGRECRDGEKYFQLLPNLILDVSKVHYLVLPRYAMTSILFVFYTEQIKLYFKRNMVHGS